MPLRHNSIDVRVSQRILWIGSEAYPLHNITRTNTLTLTPKRGVAIRQYLLSVVVWLAVAFTLMAAAPGTLTAMVCVAVVGWLVVKTIKLVAFLKLRLYQLVIETAAASHQALVSDDGHLVVDLAVRITDAISNPLAEFQMRVENFHLGDNVNMHGNENVGKVVR